MSKKICPNKKKVRGWPRRINALNKWGADIAFPNLEEFESRGTTYDRCYKSPWYRLKKRNPPIWHFRLIINHFINAFDEWNKVFSERNEPFDLQFLLFTKTYIRSELCCDKVEAVGDRKNYFEPNGIEKPFPYELFGTHLNKLTWELCDELNFFDEEELIDIYGSAQDFESKGYTQWINKDGGIYFTYKLGEVWAGRSSIFSLSK